MDSLTENREKEFREYREKQTEELVRQVVETVNHLYKIVALTGNDFNEIGLVSKITHRIQINTMMKIHILERRKKAALEIAIRLDLIERKERHQRHLARIIECCDNFPRRLRFWWNRRVIKLLNQRISHLENTIRYGLPYGISEVISIRQGVE